MAKSSTKTNRARGKAHQKATAEIFNALNLGTLGGVDVLHERYAIECKSRIASVVFGWMDQAKKYARKYKKVPMVILHKKHSPFANDMVIVPVKEFVELLSRAEEKKEWRKTTKSPTK